ncbi:MAG TPA: hypothetical protein VFY90_12655, partial [Tepidiformaceae bacterium]|nr:hypothetical protein [Tepidiformaceae bacterium]
MDQMTDALSAYAAHRDELFDTVVRRLEADEAVRAAWLSGAHGRGEDDEWSDFDFCVAVLDEALDGIIANPMPLFELAGQVLLTQADFPSDTIPGGRFWLVVYPGPVHIDWNVGPLSRAARPAASLVLFEKDHIPVAGDPQPVDGDEARGMAQKALEFFWAMAPIAIKYAGRGWTRRAVQQEALLAGAFEQLCGLARGHVLRSQDEYDQNRLPDAAMLAAVPALGREIGPAAMVDAICG